jgi:hypothetical protein
MANKNMNDLKANQECCEKVMITQEELSKKLYLPFASTNQKHRGLFEPKMSAKIDLKYCLNKRGEHDDGKKK